MQRPTNLRNIDEILKDITECGVMIMESSFREISSKNNPCKEHFYKKARNAESKRDFYIKELELTNYINNLEKKNKKA